eukprot:jgi/Chlat1/7888/Chrsp66S07315
MIHWRVAAAGAMVAAKSAAVLGEELLAERSKVNNCVALIKLLRSTATSAASEPAAVDEVCQALRCLQVFFSARFQAGEVARGKATANGEAENGSMDEKLVYAQWLRRQYRAFVKAAQDLLGRRPDTHEDVTVAALDALMRLVRAERPGTFYNDLYLEVVDALLNSRAFNGKLLGVFIQQYMQYGDVRLYTFSNVRKCVARRLELIASGMQTVGRPSLVMMKNQMTKLKLLPQSVSHQAPRTTRVLSMMFCQTQPHPPLTMSRLLLGLNMQANFDEDAEKPSKKRKVAKQAKPSWQNPSRIKQERSEAWLQFLRLPFPLDVYKKVLTKMHTDVIPHITNPVLLSDFLTNSYNIGGLTSVLALNGLFILITQHGLEYPEFYKKLYALLDSSLFAAKHRVRFFQLADACLKSSHLPAYLVAAFAKRLSRLALQAPPSGAALVIAFVHNLLRRHPSCGVLVHNQLGQRGRDEAVTGAVNEGERETEAQRLAVSVKESTTTEEPFVFRSDPYLFSETDPAKCRALESSLWELETLRSHYGHTVSRFVSTLEIDLSQRRKTSELPISDFVHGSYASLVEEEVDKRLKKVPLAFYAKHPSRLFEASVEGTAHFGGWTFD